MKIVWLCHFANDELKTLFNTPHQKEFAPWINNLIKLFRERNDIQLHIVAPNIFTNKKQYFISKNVHYHFYQHRPSFIPKKVHSFLRFESNTNFYFVKKRIERKIININPDIIHLHGAENPYYSAGILPLVESYPTLVTIQGFIRNTSIHNRIINKRILIEEEILKKTMHIGVRTKEMSETVLELNPNAHLHFHNYPLTVPAYIKDSSIESTFDIIFFARVTKDKGIEDLLKALVLVKRIKPNVSLQVIGGSSKSYLRSLQNKTKQFDIESNVKFLGFMESQQDIFRHAMHAKICVLPTYHDIIPGTIIESMFMKLPVIAYAMGGIPDLNNKGETLVLVEKHNIQQLANNILNLLQNEGKRNSLAEYAYIQASERFDNKNVVNDIIQAYTKVLSVKSKNN